MPSGGIPVKFEAIDTRQIYVKIVEQIRRYIERGELKPGDKLPSERRLAESLGVSRTSVREALSILNIEGVITRKPGRGTRVQNVDKGSLQESITVLTDTGSPLEVLEAREEIEPRVAYLAAKKATADDLEALESVMDQLIAASDSDDYPTDLDIEFHILLGHATHNRFLAQITRLINTEREQLERFANPNALERRDGHIKSHYQLFKAVKEGRARDAEHLMRQHIRSIKSHVLEADEQ